MDKVKWVEWFAQFVDKPFFLEKNVYVIEKTQPITEGLAAIGIGLYIVVSDHNKFVCSIKCDFNNLEKVEWSALYFEQSVYGQLLLTDVAKGIELYKEKIHDAKV